MHAAFVSTPARSAKWGFFSVARLVRIVVMFTTVLLLATVSWMLVRRLTGALQVSATVMFGFWLVALAGTMAAWFPRLRWSPADGGRRVDTNSKAADRLGLFPADAVGTAAGDPGVDYESDREVADTEESEQLLPEHVSQRIVRARDERGAEVVFGTVRCRFSPGQRQQSIHLAFCPPLPRLAQLETDQVAGPSVQIKTVTAETFGAGLEVKLAASSKVPTEVQIQFFAFEKSPGAPDD